jgi:tetratricopeptide (TPR) repeat protein
MMSSEAEEEAEKEVCANCGIAGVDDIKLEECDGCDLVKYCSDNCREEHRERHEEECKKRSAKLHDDDLFTQPDGIHLEECPLCFLPMPLDESKHSFVSCCGQTICDGCVYAHVTSNIHDLVKAATCAFCRTLTSDVEEYGKRKKERIEANDPAVLCHMGSKHYNAGDYDKAFEYYTKAAESRYPEAHYRLGYMYMEGEGPAKDKDKAIYHYEKAAIDGHPVARFNLGCHEEDNGRLERAVKHYIIAAKLGEEDAMKYLLSLYKDGYITKEEYEATLRSHQAAIDATKSAQRDAAEASGFFSS